jgi:hypothetical protein
MQKQREKKKKRKRMVSRMFFRMEKKKKKGGRGDGEENARLREMGEENEKIKNNKKILKNNI